MEYIIDTLVYAITEDCIACGACLPECANMAIHEVVESYTIDQTACDGCGNCVQFCPVEAILPID